MKRVLCFEWYDGPVAGLVEVGSTYYAFRLVATDEGQDARLFAFTPITYQTFKEFSDWWAAKEPPRWPLWLVGIRSAEPVWDAFSVFRGQKLQSIGQPTDLVLTGENGLLVGDIDLLEIPAALQSNIPAEPDWGGLSDWTSRL